MAPPRRLCHAAHAWSLFRACLEDCDGFRRGGNVMSIHPGLEEVAAAARGILAPNAASWES